MSQRTFQTRLTELAAKARSLGSKESRLAFMFKYDDPDEPTVRMGPLSECYAVALRNGSMVRSYRGGKNEVSSMVAFNRGHWHKGTAIWGCPGWFEHRLTKNLFAVNPGGGKKGMWRPEGHLRDLQETDEEWNVCFNEKKPSESERLAWTGQLFSEILLDSGSKRIMPGLVTPTLLTRLIPKGGPKHWLTLRQSIDLDNLVERIVNRRAYKILSLEDDICAPMNGRVTMKEKVTTMEYPGHLFESTDKREPEFTCEVVDPTRSVQDIIYSYFGVPADVQLFPMVKTQRSVVKHEALYTPVEEQARNPDRVFRVDELKKMRCWGVLQYIAVLSATQVVGADVPEDHYDYVNSDVAFSDSEPQVYLHSDFPRVQRLISDPSAFKSRGISYEIDMMDVPLRSAMRSNREKIESKKVLPQPPPKAKQAPRPTPKPVQAKPAPAPAPKPVQAKPAPASPKAEAKLRLVEQFPSDLTADELSILALFKDSNVYHARLDLWNGILDKTQLTFVDFEQIVPRLAKRGLIVIGRKTGMLRRLPVAEEAVKASAVQEAVLV